MKILLVAPESDYTRQISRALVSLGHDVVWIDDRIDYSVPASMRTWRLFWRFSRRIPFLRRRSNHALQKKILTTAMQETPSVLLATKGMNIKPQTLALFKGMHITTAVWFPDNAANEPYASWVRSTGVLWDHFFSFDSAIYEQMPTDTHDRVHVLPFGVGADAYAGDSTAGEYRCDICFIGAPYPDRVRLLESIGDLDLKIWGWSGWKDTPLRDRYRGPLNAQASAKAYRSAKICVNTNIRPLAKGVNVKTFEITASGGFELADHPADMDDSFAVGKELDVFTDETDFREKVEYWLSHDHERTAVAAAGRARTLRDHTLRGRLDELIRTIGL